MRRRGVALAAAIVLLVLLWQGAAFAVGAQRVVPSATAVKLTRGDKTALTALVMPETADQRVTWRSNKPAVASVTATGQVTGRKPGSALLRVSSVENPKIYAVVRVKVLKGVTPQGVTLRAPSDSLPLGGTLALSASVRPAAASQALVFTSSDEKVATVSDAGVVSAVGVGKTYVIARSAVKNSARARVELRVYDPDSPQSVTIGADSGYLAVGQSRTLSYTIVPDTAQGGVLWSSSAPSVVSITSGGVMRGVKAGRATITCKAARGDASDTLSVLVMDDERTDQIPKRTTTRSAAAIKENLEAIDRVYASAVNVLDNLTASGKITQAEFSKRRAILINAFSMYRFPWYTTVRVPYWTSAYAGKKDFYPDTVYYGLPYIQTGADNRYTNRRYNVPKAIAQGFYAQGEGDCYRITAKRQASRYVGNDCSAFVCMSTFPANGVPLSNSLCYLITRNMLTSSAFNIILDYDDLRPGDLLVMNGHTVMFLYYASADNSKMMIIEQGGGNLTTDIHNTVTCSVVNRASYSGKYRVRRATFLAKR